MCNLCVLCGLLHVTKVGRCSDKFPTHGSFELVAPCLTALCVVCGCMRVMTPQLHRTLPEVDQHGCEGVTHVAG